MFFPKPIRFDVDTWLVMRTDPVLPKAVIRRVHGAGGDRYLLFQWDLVPAKRLLRGAYETLERASSLVLFDPPANVTPGRPPHEFVHGEPTPRQPAATAGQIS
jgi:hypothetical protein